MVISQKHSVASLLGGGEDVTGDVSTRTVVYGSDVVVAHEPS